MNTKLSFVILIFVLITSACVGGATNAPKIEIGEPWVRATGAMQQGGQMSESGSSMGKMSGVNSAAYMVIKNSGGAPDKLVSASCDFAESVETHITKMEGDIMKMQPVDGFEVPANGQTELKPGSYHIMFIGVKRDLKAGEKVQLVLNFEKTGPLTVEAEVRMP